MEAETGYLFTNDADYIVQKTNLIPVG